MRIMFATGWRRFGLHFRRNWGRNIRFSFFFVLCTLVGCAVGDEVVRVITWLMSHSQDEAKEPFENIVTICVSALIFMTVTTTFIDAYMECKREQKKFREEIGFGE